MWQWVVGTAVGLAISGALTYSHIDTRDGDATALDWIVMTTLGGIIVGTGQWLVIRKMIVRAWAWLPVFAAGWCLSVMFVTLVLGFDPGEYMYMPDNTFWQIAVVGGIVVGIAQWIVWWRRYVGGWVWPISSVFGTAFGAFAGVQLGMLLLVFRFIKTAAPAGGVTGLIAGGIYGLATGIVILKIVPDTTPAPAEGVPLQIQD
jgi:hypothetical protein